MMRFKLLGGVLVSVFLLLFFSAVAGATILPINGDLGGPPPAGSESGTLVATATGAYTLAGSITGEVSEAVYSVTGPTTSNSPLGAAVCAAGATCLDFVYQFTNTNTNHGVNTFTVSDFDNLVPWITDVYQSANKNPNLNIGIFTVPGGTNVQATDATSGGMGPDGTVNGGDTIGFNTNDGGTHGESYILIIKTNATLYVPGSVSLISNKTATSNVPNIAGYQPWGAYYQGGTGFGPITNTNTGAFALNGIGYSNTFLAPIATPEPGFYGVLAIGLAGIFVALKYRRNKQTA
jgi:hypothetical protein